MSTKLVKSIIIPIITFSFTLFVSGCVNNSKRNVNQNNSLTPTIQCKNDDEKTNNETSSQTNLISYNDSFWNKFKEYNYEMRSNMLLEDFNKKNLNDIHQLHILIKEKYNNPYNSNNPIDLSKSIEKLIKNDISLIINFGKFKNLPRLALSNKQMLYLALQGCPMEGFLRTTQNSNKTALFMIQNLADLRGKKEGILHDCLEFKKVLCRASESPDIPYCYKFDQILDIIDNDKQLKKNAWNKNRTLISYKTLLTYIAKHYKIKHDTICNKTNIIASIELPDYMIKYFKEMTLIENRNLIFPNAGLVVGGEIKDGGMDCSTTATTISSGSQNRVHIYPWYIEYYWLLSVDLKSKSDKKFKIQLNNFLNKLKLKQVYHTLLNEAKRAILDIDMKAAVELLYQKFIPIIPELDALQKGDIINHREISGIFRFGHSSLFIGSSEVSYDKDEYNKFVRIFDNSQERSLSFSDKKPLYVYNSKNSKPTQIYRFLSVLRPRKEKQNKPCNFKAEDNYKVWKTCSLAGNITLLLGASILATNYLAKFFQFTQDSD